MIPIDEMKMRVAIPVKIPVIIFFTWTP